MSSIGNEQIHGNRAPEKYQFQPDEFVFVDGERESVFSIVNFTEEKGVLHAQLKDADGETSFIEVSRLSPAALEEGKLDLLRDDDAPHIPMPGQKPN